jgi:hypothetical protein
MTRTATTKRANAKPSRTATRRPTARRQASRPPRANRLAGIRVYLLGISDRLTRVASAVEADEPAIAVTLRRQVELTAAVVEPGVLENATDDELDLLLAKAASTDPLSVGLVVPD